jgi:lipoprotein-releasing system permease protein
MIKGVSPGFADHSRLKESIVEGELILADGKTEYAILGRGVQNTLDMASLDNIFPIQVSYPKRNSNLLDPAGSVNHQLIMPGGIFAIEKQFDMNYMITPLSFAERLFEYSGRRTAIEIDLADPDDSGRVKERLQKLLGGKFRVLDREEQHASLLRVIKWEKFFVFIIFSFIIAVSAINIFFSLTMLVLDKRRDIAILQAMGSGKTLIRNIFFKEGAIIAFTGAAAGLVLGCLICLIQQEFGLVSLGIETSVIAAYPVKMKLTDLLFTSFSIILITVAFSIRPAVMASRSEMIRYLS